MQRSGVNLDVEYPSVEAGWETLKEAKEREEEERKAMEPYLKQQMDERHKHHLEAYASFASLERIEYMKAYDLNNNGQITMDELEKSYLLELEMVKKMAKGAPKGEASVTIKDSQKEQIAHENDDPMASEMGVLPNGVDDDADDADSRGIIGGIE